MENKISKYFILPFVIAIIMTISVADLPYGFYTLMRIIVPMLSAIFAVLLLIELDGFSLILIPNILIAIIWNPILPVYLDKDTWIVIDIVAGISQVIMGFYALYLQVKSE